MKAALLTKVGEPLELREIVWGVPNYGSVLVKMTASGICGAQIQEWRGEKGSHFPRLLGHEGVGVVQATGGGVTHVSVGDKVVCHWRKGAGIESPSPNWWFPGGDMMNYTAGQVTTFSDYATISENRLTKVPSDAPDELCCLLGCSLSTALGTIENEANLRFGESVLIIGCGGLGLNLILAAKLRQASFILAVDTAAEKKEMALKMGAHYFGRYGNGVDVVIDTTGDATAIDHGIECLAPSGRFIMVGQPRGNITIPNAWRMFEGDGKTIQATQGGRFEPHKDIPRYVSMYRAGLLNLDGLISHRFPLSKINDGLELVRQGQAGRILIDCAT